jgi:hypothetical protein
VTAPATTDVFGPLVSAADVEDQLQTVLERWFPTYLYAVERHVNTVPGTLPLPRGIVRSSGIEKFPEDQLPVLIIASPGLTDPPMADGAGYYTATWRIHLGVQVVAAPNRRALELARWYTLALRACVLQQQQDPELPAPIVPIVRVDWRDERYDLLDSIDDRTVCVGVVELAVPAAMVTQRNAGPLDPIIGPQPPDPNAPAWPVAATVDTTVTKEPL